MALADGMRRILILGGTLEARQIAERLAGRADLAVTLSLAGRTAAPVKAVVPMRVGGFGGAAGLARHLAAARVDVLVDATHPYAATISAHAAEAAAAAKIPLLALRRPAWIATAGDRWTEVADAAGAARQALGAAPREVFLALGRQEIAPFATAPQHHYLVRSVEPVVPPLAVPHAVYVTGRGPFREVDERALLLAAPHRNHRGQEQRRQRKLWQDRGRPRARGCGDPAAPAAAAGGTRVRGRGRDRRGRDSPGSIMRWLPPRAACRQGAGGRRVPPPGFPANRR